MSTVSIKFAVYNPKDGTTSMYASKDDAIKQIMEQMMNIDNEYVHNQMYNVVRINEDGSQTEIYQPYIPLTWCGEPTRFSITQEQINKFVELIVQECIELNRQELAFNAFERMLNRYREHFGVE